MTFETPDPAPTALIEQARQQLMKKFNLAEEAIFLLSSRRVEWPDEGLGCPRQGTVYAQVITPGYQIQFEAGGRVYTFHTDTGYRIILCDEQGPGEIYLPP